MHLCCCGVQHPAPPLLTQSCKPPGCQAAAQGKRHGAAGSHLGSHLHARAPRHLWFHICQWAVGAW